MKYHCIMSVWGDEYTDLFLRAAVANQLQPGNLPELARKAEVTYVVHTTSRDAARIRSHPAFGLLAKTVSVQVEEDDAVNLENRYHALAAFHAKALARAGSEGAALMFLAPDLFFPDGVFARVHELRLSGKRVILAPGPRGLKEALAQRFLEAGEALERGEGVRLGPREMVRMLMEHPHRLFEQLQHDSPRFFVWPSHVYWRVPDQGFVLRAFHLHPILVEPGAGAAAFSKSVDGDLIDALDIPDEAFHVAEDSDDLFALDLTRDADHDYQPPNRLDPAALAEWARENAPGRHRGLFERIIRLRAADPGPAWALAEEKSHELLRDFNLAAKQCGGPVAA